MEARLELNFSIQKRTSTLLLINMKTPMFAVVVVVVFKLGSKRFDSAPQTSKRRDNVSDQ